MSFETIQAAAERVRTEQQLGGIKKGFIADMFDDVNVTKASNADLALKINRSEFTNYQLQDWVLTYDRSKFTFGWMSRAEIVQPFRLDNADATLSSNRTIWTNGKTFVFRDGAVGNNSKIGIDVQTPTEKLHVNGAVLADRYRFGAPTNGLARSIHTEQDGNLYYTTANGITTKLNGQSAPRAYASMMLNISFNVQSDMDAVTIYNSIDLDFEITKVNSSTFLFKDVNGMVDFTDINSIAFLPVIYRHQSSLAARINIIPIDSETFRIDVQDGDPEYLPFFTLEIRAYGY